MEIILWENGVPGFAPVIKQTQAAARDHAATPSL